MAETAGNVLVGLATVKVGTAGAVATTTVGYTQDGCQIQLSEEVERIMMDQGNRPVKIVTTSQSEVITLTFGEATLGNFEYVTQGWTKSGNTLTLGDSTNDEISLRIEGTDPNGTERVWTIPYARAVTDVTYSYVKGEAQVLSASFEVLEKSGTDPITIQDAVDTKVTLASGVLTRVADQVIHTVRGEGGEADTLTSITGASLVDGERVVLRIGSVSEPITLKHLAETLELDGEADWTMDSLDDEITLQYATSGAVWSEVARINA